jgi:hypothetical protein
VTSLQLVRILGRLVRRVTGLRLVRVLGLLVRRAAGLQFVRVLGRLAVRVAGRQLDPGLCQAISSRMIDEAMMLEPNAGRLSG